jgi:hypothetical protein
MLFRTVVPIPQHTYCNPENEGSFADVLLKHRYLPTKLLVHPEDPSLNNHGRENFGTSELTARHERSF